MDRRELLVLLAARGIAGPAGAQQKAIPVIGFLSSGSAELFAPVAAAFRDRLGEAGYVEGRNVDIEFAWAAGR